MTVERPYARIIGMKGNIPCFTGSYMDGTFQHSVAGLYSIPVGSNDSKLVPVNMNRVSFLNYIAKSDAYVFTLPYNEGRGIGKASHIHGREIKIMGMGINVVDPRF